MLEIEDIVHTTVAILTRAGAALRWSGASPWLLRRRETSSEGLCGSLQATASLQTSLQGPLGGSQREIDR
jgi:hypothetical protein